MRKTLFAFAALLVAASASAQPGPMPVTVPYVVSTTGAVNLTGTTAETNLAALKIPANTIGKNGAIEVVVLWTYTNSSNVKTMQLRFTQAAGATSGGSVGTAITATTTTTTQGMTFIRNNNATNAQTYFTLSPVAPFGAAGVVPGTASTDTTQDSYINLNGQLALGTETITLQHAYAVVYPKQ